MAEDSGISSSHSQEDTGFGEYYISSIIGVQWLSVYLKQLLLSMEAGWLDCHPAEGGGMA